MTGGEEHTDGRTDGDGERSGVAVAMGCDETEKGPGAPFDRAEQRRTTVHTHTHIQHVE